jgi:hypothetical protein
MADDREQPPAITAAVFACREADTPMPFALYREQDVTGVSGEGAVAHGARFADGTVVLRWLGKDPSTVLWGSLDAAMRIHGHDGRTRVVWLAAPFSEMGLAEQEAAAAERERIADLMDALAANYPEGVFPPDSDVRDAIGGTAMRHAYRNAARTIREAAGTEPS